MLTNTLLCCQSDYYKLDEAFGKQFDYLNDYKMYMFGSLISF